MSKAVTKKRSKSEKTKDKDLTPILYKTVTGDEFKCIGRIDGPDGTERKWIIINNGEEGSGSVSKSPPPVTDSRSVKKDPISDIAGLESLGESKTPITVKEEKHLTVEEENHKRKQEYDDTRNQIDNSLAAINKRKEADKSLSPSAVTPAVEKEEEKKSDLTNTSIFEKTEFLETLDLTNAKPSPTSELLKNVEEAIVDETAKTERVVNFRDRGPIKLDPGELLAISVTFSEAGFVKSVEELIDDKGLELMIPKDTKKVITTVFKELQRISVDYRGRKNAILNYFGEKISNSKNESIRVIPAGREEALMDCIQKLFEERDEKYVKGVVAKFIRYHKFLRDEEEIQKTAINNKRAKEAFSDYGIKNRDDVDALPDDDLDQMCIDIWGSRVKVAEALAGDRKEQFQNEMMGNIREKIAVVTDQMNVLMSELTDDARAKKKDVKELAELLEDAAKARVTFNDDETMDLFETVKNLTENYYSELDKKNTQYNSQAEKEKDRLQGIIRNQVELQRSLPPEKRYQKLEIPENNKWTCKEAEKRIKGRTNYVELMLAAGGMGRLHAQLVADGKTKEAKKVAKLKKQLETKAEEVYKAVCERAGFCDDYEGEDYDEMGNVIKTTTHPFKENLDGIVVDTAMGRPTNIINYGPAGNGKTTIGSLVADAMNAELVQLRLSPETSQGDFVGDKGIAAHESGKFTITTHDDDTITGISLRKIAELSNDHAVIIQLEEINLVDPSVLKAQAEFWTNRTTVAGGKVTKGDKANCPVIGSSNEPPSDNVTGDESNARRFGTKKIGHLSKEAVVKVITSSKITTDDSLVITNSFAKSAAGFLIDVRNALDFSSSGTKVKYPLSRIGSSEVFHPTIDHVKELIGSVVNHRTLGNAISIFAEKVIGSVPNDSILRKRWAKNRGAITKIAQANFKTGIPYNSPIDDNSLVVTVKGSQTSLPPADSSNGSTEPISHGGKGASTDFLGNMTNNYGVPTMTESEYGKWVKKMKTDPKGSFNNFVVVPKGKKKIVGFWGKKNQPRVTYSYTDSLGNKHAAKIGLSSSLVRSIESLGLGTLVYNGQSNDGESVYKWLPDGQRLNSETVTGFDIKIKDLDTSTPTIQIAGITIGSDKKHKDRIDSEVFSGIAAAAMAEMTRTGDYISCPDIAEFYKEAKEYYDDFSSNTNVKYNNKFEPLFEDLWRGKDDLSAVTGKAAFLHEHLYQGLTKLMKRSIVSWDNHSGYSYKSKSK